MPNSNLGEGGREVRVNHAQKVPQAAEIVGKPFQVNAEAAASAAQQSEQHGIVTAEAIQGLPPSSTALQASHRPPGAARPPVTPMGADLLLRTFTYTSFALKEPAKLSSALLVHLK
ncbi:hypothetical protein K437DRAFT_294992 [Tilletiaria anomala UBC 951]|uniref:SMP domain-containing protein n=1 Tax=Tilletiaria anomala (strain ATCC 24038 / CBS 436.72 / UBC 951) TaxID=1037660 RepID=A0A066VYS0_TILAU|nr:uncharacterized protein K437DRAFT_294992 [Tilletiaria anomala UBC 951]KDN43959.1 hypothetical protein K437DRAFT_294992 [Tilletiaria anomala UBC 951]